MKIRNNSKVYPIVAYGDPVLTRRAETVGVFNTPELGELLRDMFETMYAAKGVGLAAPQIGISKRIAVIDVSGKFPAEPAHQIILINPFIVHSDPGVEYAEEGCLSLPGFHAPVGRAMIVTVQTRNFAGEESPPITATGVLARAIIHEVEHLDGKLYLEHLTPLRRNMIKSKIRKRRREGTWQSVV